MITRPRIEHAAAAAAGAIMALAFAPYSIVPLAVLCPAILIWLWRDATPRQAAWHGFWFNAGTFAVGTYWLYISIHGFGEAPLWIAFGLMAGLVGIMALYGFALGYVVARFLPPRGLLRLLVGIPAAWVLIEWWRGWFLTGFAWLSLGYSQTDTWLAGYAPIFGVYGITAILVVSAGALVALIEGTRRQRIIAAVVALLLWVNGAPLLSLPWTHANGPAVSVAVVQGAIPQDQKWQDANRETTLNLYRDLTRGALGARVIVWPEAAPPDLASNLADYLLDLYHDAHAHGSALVMGILRADGDNYYNSVLSLGESVGWYSKHHLVPFAEFFPVPSFVRSWLRLNSLPYADFERGAARQPPLDAGGLKLAASICYEDAYGSSELAALAGADALVNVTNDAWFGHSSARYQHFQIARMRAIEARRYLIRAANDGVSGIIGPFGDVVAMAPEYRPTVLKASIVPRRGLPPYAWYGNWLIICLAGTTLLLALVWRRLGSR